MNGKAKSNVTNNGTADRAGRSSPYARPIRKTPLENPSTPSRIGSLLSGLFSPFRSSSKKAELKSQLRDLEQLQSRQEQLASQANGDDLVIQSSTSSEADEDPDAPPPLDYRVETSGSLSRKIAAFDASGPSMSTPQPTRFFDPPSPQSTRTLVAPRLSGNLGMNALQRRESFAMDMSPPKQANDLLAEFFSEKGDRPLTAVETAGVLQLIQQSQSETMEKEALPTVFTPNFRSRSSQIPPSIRPSTPQNAMASSSSTLFTSPSTSTLNSLDTTPFRRRRPLYVGAGYSTQTARRRKQNGTLSGAFRSSSNENELDRSRLSQSESTLSGLAMAGGEIGSSTADGKRRRMEDSDEAPPSSSTADSTLSRSFTTDAMPMTSGLGPFGTPVEPEAKSRASLTVSTPVRSSPLWQVSQAAVPSPSLQNESITPAKPPTRAADIMMDIIRQEDATRPSKVTPASITNPYDTSENAATRTPRSRASKVTATPRSRMAATALAPSPAPIKKISPLETLERTMPAGLRMNHPSLPTASIPPSNRTGISTPSKVMEQPRTLPTKILPKPFSVSPAPVAVKKKPTQVIELSDSDDKEEEEDEEEEEEQEEERVTEEIELDSTANEDEEEEEEEEETETEEDELMEEDLPAPPRPSNRSRLTPPPSFTASPPQSRVTSSKKRSALPSLLAASLVAAPSVQTGESKASLPPSSQIAFAAADIPEFGPTSKRSNPSPAPTVAPSFPAAPSAFTFTPISTSTSTPIGVTPTPVSSLPSISVATSFLASDEAAKSIALETPIKRLPTFDVQLNSRNITITASEEEADELVKGVRRLVKEMGAAELPTITL